MFFISVVIFFNFNRWFFFYYYFLSSMLKFSLCSSIFVLDSVSILITDALNSGQFFISVSLVVFCEFSLVLSLKQIHLSSHFAYYSLYEIK